MDSIFQRVTAAAKMGTVVVRSRMSVLPLLGVAHQAPAGNLSRAPLPDARRLNKTGVPLTASDREIVDESNEGYLIDAGVSTPPRGYRGYLHRPGTMTDQQF